MPANADEKTEPATPRRRREAREKGEVARSQDLTAAVLLLSGFIGLALLGPGIWHMLLTITRAALGGEPITTLQEVLPFAGAVAVEAMKTLIPFLLIIFLSMLATLFAQVGFLLTLEPLMPSLKKINPITGVQRLFSLQSIMLGVINMGKLLSVGLVAYFVLSGNAAAVIYAFSFEYSEVFRLGSKIMFRLAMWLGAALLVLALLDYAWQRHRRERDMRMTKAEVKDELRNMEGDPEVKRRQRQVQLQLANQRLRKEVPGADVIVTNPTHVAVAIKYESETMVAPKVVAKGGDELALRIRQIAAEFSIPIVARPPLARALYESVRVGEYVPEHLYRAIAEILAYIYELTGRSPLRARTDLVGA